MTHAGAILLGPEGHILPVLATREAIIDLATDWFALHGCWTSSFFTEIEFSVGTDMAHLRAGQSMFISMLLGGRVVYTGKDIHAAHARVRDLGLNDTHYDTFLKHFPAALEEVGVKAEKAEKVMKLLESKREVVLHH
jgi:hypothetical protein